MPRPQHPGARPGVYVTLTNPTSRDVEEECNAWYERHMADALRLPGRLSAHRYRMVNDDEQLVAPSGRTALHRYLTVYELDDVANVPEARALLPWLTSVTAEPTSPTLDIGGLAAAVFETISVHTSVSTPPRRHLAEAADGALARPAVIIWSAGSESEGSRAAHRGSGGPNHADVFRVPGFVRVRRIRLAIAREQMNDRHAAMVLPSFVTFIDVEDMRCIQAARHRGPP